MCNVSYVSRQASSGSDGQASAATLSILGEGIVGIAVQPTLAGLRRGDRGVPAGGGMLRGVAVGRVVAAERGAALLTRSEMHPVPADLHALVTHAPLRLLDRRNRAQVRTGSNRRHACPLLLIDRCVKLTKNGGPCGGGDLGPPRRPAPSRLRRVPSVSPSSRPTMSRSFMHRAGAALALAGITASCGGRIQTVASTEPVAAAPSTVDRMTVRTGEQVVVVDSPAAAGRHVERMVQETGGYLERSSGSSAGNVRIEGRVTVSQRDI